MHSGQWKDRGKMAWSAFGLGATMILNEIIGPYVGIVPSETSAGGVTLCMAVITIMVAGKVVHDNNMKNKDT